MYAILETGGKQYKVTSGDTIKVEKINADKGSEVTIEKVLTIVTDDKSILGAPYIKGAAVKAEVADSGKLDKVIIHKQRPRRVYRKTRGHRQPYTALKIKEIVYE